MTNTANNGFQFDKPSAYPERLFLQGKAQDIIKEISFACGLYYDLKKRKRIADAIHDNKFASNN